MNEKRSKARIDKKEKKIDLKLSFNDIYTNFW